MTDPEPSVLPQSIEMLHRYPFLPSATSPGTVRLTRRFRQHQYCSLRQKVQTHSRLRHPSLINILKATVNHTSLHFTVFLEHVPYPIGEALTSLTIKQVADNQLRLLQLCERLIAMNIHPQVSADKLGITEDGDIKLYLDIDYCELSGKEDKQELMMAKKLEVNSVFNRYLGEVPSLRHYRSAPHINPYREDHARDSRRDSKEDKSRYTYNSPESEVCYKASTKSRKQQKQYSKYEESVNHRPYEQTFNKKQIICKVANSRVPTAYEKQVEMRDDTLNQELGEEAEMPRITIPGLRQTAPTSKLQNKLMQESHRGGYSPNLINKQREKQQTSREVQQQPAMEYLAPPKNPQKTRDYCYGMALKQQNELETQQHNLQQPQESVSRYVPSDNEDVEEGIEKDFNKLFDSHYVDEQPKHHPQQQHPYQQHQPQQQHHQDQPQPEPEQPKTRKVSQAFSNRVKTAMERSQAMLDYFYSNNTQNY